MPSPTVDRVVPASFEDYVDANYLLLVHPRGCTGCHSGPAIARDAVNSYCEPCIRYSWGYDQAEEKLIRMMIGGALRSAAASGASETLIRAAVEAALADAFYDED